jgi:hypothetical protein
LREKEEDVGMRNMSFKQVAIAGPVLLVLAAVTVMCGPDRARDAKRLEGVTAKTTQALAACGCPWTTKASTSAVARLYGGGDSGHDELILEDAINNDTYRWAGGTAWHRVGGPARSYAYAYDPSLGPSWLGWYRNGNDARADHMTDENDNWARISPIAQSSAGSSYTAFSSIFSGRRFLYAGDGTHLYRSDGGGWGSEDDGTLAQGGVGLSYVGDASYVYKRTASGVYRTAGGAVWTRIGATAPNAIYAGGGATFIDIAGAISRYSDAGGWSVVGSGIRKITGTSATAYALNNDNTVALFDSASSTWSIIRAAADVSNIVAGTLSLFAITTAGAVLEYTGGTWTDLTCTGAHSAANCAGGCDPGPDPSEVAPGYGDAPFSAQNDLNNAKYDVLTQHNDIARTGAMLSSDVLTPASVSGGTFGYLGNVAVQGRIYGQALYMDQAAVVCTGDTVRNKDIAYVATIENNVYAIDVQAQAVCWSSAILGCPPPTGGNFDLGHEGNVKVGIVATPVIDLAKSVMYVVARTRSGVATEGRFFLNVLDTRTGQLISRTEIIANGLDGHADCPNAAGTSQPLWPEQQTNRVGLLLLKDKLITAFSAYAGEAPEFDYHGHIVTFDVSHPDAPLRSQGSTCAVPDMKGGGIWMAGGGIASDGTDAYVTTGNGASYPFANGDFVNPAAIPDFPPPSNYPDGLVKVDTDAGVVSGYVDTRPASTFPSLLLRDSNNNPRSIYWGRERSDADFGSGGILILGDRAIAGGKDGRLYAVNTTGTLSPASRVRDFQAFIANAGPPTAGPNDTFNYQTKWYAGPHIHSGPVAWDTHTRTSPAYINVYAWSEKDHLKRFRFDPVAKDFVAADIVDATMATPFPTAHGDIAATQNAMPGGMLSISANGVQDGIVWATVQEPYKFCRYPSITGHGVIQVDEPEGPAASEVVGCDVLRGYAPGRLFAFAADPDSASPNRLRLLWGDTNKFGYANLPGGVDTRNSNVKGPNNLITAYAKHAPPTIAHNWVLVPTADNKLLIFGLGSQVASQPKRLLSDDIVLAGPAGWSTIPEAASNGNGTFTVTHDSHADFTGWAATSGVSRLSGDFDADGHTDVALLGPAGWSTIKLACSNGDGTFAIKQPTAPNFVNIWAASTTATKFVGDFDGDGRADIALTGDSSWTTIPVAFSNSVAGGTAAFVVTNSGDIAGEYPRTTEFAGWSTASSSVQRLIGDFNGDGKADIALSGVSFFTTIPVAFSTGRSGFFHVTNYSTTDSAAACPSSSPCPPLSNYPASYPTNFGVLSAQAGVTRLVGDFNGDGRSDIALVGIHSTDSTPYWGMLSVAFSSGDGSFRVRHGQAVAADGSSFSFWATSTNARKLVGDFNGDGRDDIALIGDPSWHTIPIAFSNGDGSFLVTNQTVLLPDGNNLATLAAVANVVSIVGDYDHDGTADIALTGGSAWNSIPVAMSNGDGNFHSFNVTNIANWGGWAATANAQKLPGNYR